MRANHVYRFIIAAGVVLTGAAANAGGVQAIPTPFDQDGYDVTANLAPDGCVVISSIDLPIMAAHLHDWQANHLIRPDVDAAHVATKPWTVAAALAMKLQPLFVVTTFDKHPEILTCRFGQAFVGGDGKPEIAYQFTMTRKLYDKVNWSHFTPATLPNVTQNFTLGPEMVMHMKAEDN